MDAASCRAHLARVLADEQGALVELELQLDREYAALAKRDTTALEEAADARAWQMTRLVKLEDERRSACATYGYPTDIRDLAAMLAWCNPERTLGHHYQDCVARAIRCRDANSRNAALVNARMSRIEGMLGALTGAADPARVYGRDGSKRQQSSGRMLSAEA